MIIEKLLNTFFPAFCVGCGKEGKYICEKCYVFAGESALICPVCGESSFSGERHFQCLSARYDLDGLANVWEYEGIVKKVLGTIKYRGITHALGELVQSSFQLMLADKARFGAFLEFLFVGSPMITYVPMFLQKEKKRGFNQAKLVAQVVGKITGNKVLQLLAKTKETPSQTNLTKQQRVENIKDSFGVCAKPGLAQIKNVVLVDDIWTTGATMKECCKALKKAGIKNVWGFAIARTP